MAIKAVLYSDQAHSGNARINKRLLDLIGGPGKKLSYISSDVDPDGYYHRKNSQYYQQYELALSAPFESHKPHSDTALQALFDGDAIHLPGGDTGTCLRNLKKGAIYAPLQSWIQDGGIVVGVSAGAMILTPTIAVDEFMGQSADEELPSDPSAMNILPFEFLPHFDEKTVSMDKLLHYSIHNHNPIIACPDGCGVVVCNNQIECVGEILWISKGTAYRRQVLPLHDVA